MKYIFCLSALLATLTLSVESYAHDRYRDVGITNLNPSSIGNISFTPGTINGHAYISNTISTGNTSFTYGHVSGDCNININTTSCNVGNTTYTHGFMRSPNCGLHKSIYCSYPNIYGKDK